MYSTWGLLVLGPYLYMYYLFNYSATLSKCPNVSACFLVQQHLKSTAPESHIKVEASPTSPEHSPAHITSGKIPPSPPLTDVYHHPILEMPLNTLSVQTIRSFPKEQGHSHPFGILWRLPTFTLKQHNHVLCFALLLAIIVNLENDRWTVLTSFSLESH